MKRLLTLLLALLLILSGATISVGDTPDVSAW